MGAPMAKHLIAAGHEVTVWNRTASKMAGFSGCAAPDLSTLAKGKELVILCVGRSEDVTDVVSQIEPDMAPGSLIVDHSTISPSVAIETATRLESKGIGFLDAPVTGGSMGANAGTLTIFCGGRVTDFQKAEPVLEAFAKRVAHVGPSGAGQKMKVANQIAVGGALIALCESLAYASKSGLDLKTTRELLSGGAAGSWAFENYGPKILNQDWTPGFSIKNQMKDFGYCRESAAEVGAQIPCTELVEHLLQQLLDEGHGEWTTAALYDLMAR